MPSNDRYHDSLPPKPPRRDDDYDDMRPRRRIAPAGYYRPTEDECTSGMLCHLLAIFMHFLGPIIIWVMKKDESRFVDHHGREALNFSINMALYAIIVAVIVGIITVVTCGIGAVLFPLVLIVSIYSLVMHIIALTAAKNGEWYRYPGIFRLIPPPTGMEGLEPRATYDEGPAGELGGEPRERGSMLWVWLLCGTAALLLGGCCVGGIVYAVLDTQEKSKPAMENGDTVEIKPADGLVGPVVRDQPRVEPPDRGRRGADRAKPAEQPGDPVEQAIARLKSLNLSERAQAAEMLGKSGDKRAAKALAEALKDSPTQKHVVSALKEFGSDAEDDVLRVLPESNAINKRIVCEVLGTIGTKKSLTALEPLTKDRNRFISGPAREAIDAIKARMK